MENLLDLSDQSLVNISRFLNGKFKEDGVAETNPGQWVGFEPETITMELNGAEPLPELLLDKIEILQTLNVKPELFFEETVFFCYVCNVVAGTVADPDVFLTPISVEMVAGIMEVTAVLNDWKYPLYEFSDGLKKAVAYLLKQEGFTEPMEIFNFIPAEHFEGLDGTQDKDVVEAKRKAIKAAMTYMKTRT